MTLELFARPEREELAAGACVLRGLACADDAELRRALDAVAAAAPFRHMVTPGGFRMSVAMTNCGALRLGVERQRVSLCRNRSHHGRAVAGDAGGDARARARSRGRRGFPGLHAGRLPRQSLRARRAADAAPRQGRARLRANRSSPYRSACRPRSCSAGRSAKTAWRASRSSTATSSSWVDRAACDYHGVAPLKPAQHPFAGQARINLTLRRAS